MVRGIRGAITVEDDTPELITQATKDLLSQMEKDNELEVAQICAVFFSATSDLHSAYPAVAARELGWVQVPLFCLSEMEVTSSLIKCIRVLILFNTHLSQDQIKHVYLRGAMALRPDLVGGTLSELF